jgi:oxygen-independent coproporphyrinogen-3 oxidase
MPGITHLYIHIPYCSSRCGYCDFFSTADGIETAQGYLTSLKAELDDSQPMLGEIESVYIGGGTPSYLGRAFLVELLESVGGMVRSGAEITMEANPDSIEPGLSQAVVEAGVTRISLGVQSFNPVLRGRLGRDGDPAGVAGAVEAARSAGVGQLSLDMLFNIPGESTEELERDLDQALALEPDHISCYELTVKEDSDFEQLWRKELEQSRRSTRDLYELVVDKLVAGGFSWYETSNYARDGRECRHNKAYWRGDDFIGIGAGAWSTVGERRWRNCEDRDLYIGDFRLGRRHEHLDSRKKGIEALMLGLRTSEGAEMALAEDAIDAVQLEIMIENGFVKIDGAKILLTHAGRFVANEVCARIMRDRE